MGVACISDLVVKEGLINLDFADVLAVMREKGKAMMGRGRGSGESVCSTPLWRPISNPLIENFLDQARASGLISITGGKDLSLFQKVDEGATRIREGDDGRQQLIVGASFDEGLEGIVRVSVVATGDRYQSDAPDATNALLTELAGRLRNVSRRIAGRIEGSAPPPQSSPVLAAALTPKGGRQIRIWKHVAEGGPRTASIRTRTSPREILLMKTLSIFRPSCARPVSAAAPRLSG